MVCVDGDDWISQYYLEHFSTIIDKCNPDILVYGSIYAYTDKFVECQSGLTEGFYNRTQLETELFSHLVYPKDSTHKFPAQLWAKAFKKSIYYKQQQLVNTMISIGEDRACVIPTLFHSNSMYVINYCNYYYRQIPTSMTKAKKLSEMMDHG